MVTLKQCDRCKFTSHVVSSFSTLTLDNDRHWEICETCKKDFEKWTQDGGKQLVTRR